MLDVQPLNHPRGRGDPAAYLEPVVFDGAAASTVELPGAQIHCAAFEVPYAEVMALLPPSLHPSSPAYANLTFYRVPDSEIGGFEFAVMAIACRSVIKPRMLTLSAFASSKPAADYLASKWALRCEVADVRTRNRYDAVVSELIIDGVVAARFQTCDIETLSGAARAIRYPQPLNFARVADGNGLLQTDMVYVYHEAQRGRLRIETFDAAVMTGGKIDPTDLIASTFVRADIQVRAPRIFLDLKEIGGVIKLEQANEGHAAIPA